jgi:serine/threonine-protein kinase HipA
MAASRLASFAGQCCLIVERCDRRLHASGSHWLRLPMEDLCQATGTPPEQKYENQGGPGMVAIAALLAQSAQAAEDLRCFFQAQVLFWMLRAIDGHAKNFSLFLLPGGSYRLTPLYDVLSAWPVIGKAAGQWPEQELRLAMAWHGSRSRTSKPCPASSPLAGWRQSSWPVRAVDRPQVVADDNPPTPVAEATRKLSHPSVRAIASTGFL